MIITKNHFLQSNKIIHKLAWRLNKVEAHYFVVKKRKEFLMDIELLLTKSRSGKEWIKKECMYSLLDLSFKTMLKKIAMLNSPRHKQNHFLDLKT